MKALILSTFALCAACGQDCLVVTLSNICITSDNGIYQTTAAEVDNMVRLFMDIAHHGKHVADGVTLDIYPESFDCGGNDATGCFTDFGDSMQIMRGPAMRCFSDTAFGHEFVHAIGATKNIEAAWNEPALGEDSAKWWGVGGYLYQVEARYKELYCTE